MLFRRFSNLDQLLSFYTDDVIIKLAKLGVKVSDTLSENLITMHEWLYKHYRLENAKNLEPIQDRRRNNIIGYIESEINPLLFRISEDLMDIYKDWLDKHDTENPNNWARNRLTQDEFDDYGKKGSLGQVKYEYLRFLKENGTLDKTTGVEANEIFLTEFLKINMNYFIPFFKEMIQETIAIDYEEIEHYKELDDIEEVERLQEEIKRLENIDLANRLQLEDFVEESMFDFGNSFLSEESLESDPNLYDMLINFEEKVVFPFWYDKWVSSDIESTIDENKKIYDDMQNMGHYPFYKKLTIIEKALTGMHHTGPMIDYISNKDPEITKKFMSKLNNIGTTEDTQVLIEQWDKDLRDLGFWERQL